jgi:hypothetical protein
MKKNIVILVVSIIVLAIVGGGFYWWWQNQPQNYIVVKKTAGGQLVTNKKEGVSMTVPEGWQIEKPTTKEGSISFYSPETSQQKETGDIEYGCKIESGMENKKTDINSIKKDLDADLRSYTVQLNEYKDINVSGYVAIKNIFKSAETGYSIAVYAPLKNKVYSVVIYASPNYEGICSQYFDNFLKTVSIK